MKIKLEKTILISVILISSFLITSCGKNFSISALDIQKLTQKAHKLMMEGNFEGAIGRLESINDLNPNLAENNYNLGIAYYRTDQYEKAIKSLEKAIEINEEMKDAYYTLAVIREEMADKAAEDVKKIETNKEKKVNELIKITKNYREAKDRYLSYLNLIGLNPERDKILKKIENFNEKIEKTSEKISKLG